MVIRNITSIVDSEIEMVGGRETVRHDKEMKGKDRETDQNEKVEAEVTEIVVEEIGIELAIETEWM